MSSNKNCEKGHANGIVPKLSSCVVSTVLIWLDRWGMDFEIKSGGPGGVDIIYFFLLHRLSPVSTVYQKIYRA